MMKLNQIRGMAKIRFKLFFQLRRYFLQWLPPGLISTFKATFTRPFVLRPGYNTFSFRLKYFSFYHTIFADQINLLMVS